jgi:Arc/MetJ-type ribon-helix-helix transcriptional regulator
MTILNISLSEELKEFLEAELVCEGFASESDYLRNLVQEARKRRAKLDLESLPLEGLQSPSTPISHEELLGVERDALEGLPDESIPP